MKNGWSSITFVASQVMRSGRLLMALSLSAMLAAAAGLASPAAASSVKTSPTAPAQGGGFYRGAATGLAGHPVASSVTASPDTPRNGLCTGTWTNPVSNVFLQRSKNGTLAWGFKLTNIAIEKLGPVVEVTMPTATVNGKALSPTPYSPHTEYSTYNFHGSLYRYHVYRDGNHVIATGNKIFFYWVIFGSSGEDAYRYIRCTVPRPGSG